MNATLPRPPLAPLDPARILATLTERAPARIAELRTAIRHQVDGHTDRIWDPAVTDAIDRLHLHEHLIERGMRDRGAAELTAACVRAIAAETDQ